MTWIDHIIYGLAWIGFGLGHSWLTRPGAKAWLDPILGRGYRLAYNVFALVHVSAVFVLGEYVLADGASFAIPEAGRWAMSGVQVIGAGFSLAALSRYDLGLFSGLAQLRTAGDEPDREALRIDGIHRLVRHPLYSGLFLILWGRATGEAALATAIWGSLYVLIGTWHEERGLIRAYGESYRRYRRKVPAFVPWRGLVNPDEGSPG